MCSIVLNAKHCCSRRVWTGARSTREFSTYSRCLFFFRFVSWLTNAGMAVTLGAVNESWYWGGKCSCSKRLVFYLGISWWPGCLSLVMNSTLSATVTRINTRGSGNMMTSSNGNIFRVTGLLCGEFTGHRWIPRTKASDAELRCFLWSPRE